MIIKSFIKHIFLIFFFFFSKLFSYHKIFTVKFYNIVIRQYGIDQAVRIFSFLDNRTYASILKKLGANIGNNVRIVTPIHLANCSDQLKQLQIGDNCHIGKDVFFDMTGPISIGDNVTISMRSTLITHMNVGDVKMSDKSLYNKSKGVVIESNVYIGCGAIILDDVRVGKNSMVGAGAVVTQSIPSNSLAVGVPAKVKKMKRGTEE
jgi:acetyltransferase-like isoleucine patch superfamily enzyme